MNRNQPFWLFTLSVGIALIVPVLIQDGMFMDGQQYACVAKNLSDGLGTFWFPHLSQTWWKAGSSYFLEHPPLVYGIQSVFFLVLGESMYVERFYSLLTAVITAYLIVLIWKMSYAEHPEMKALSWIPVLLWIVIPVCYWSYRNNMMENTMGLFTTAAVYFIFRGLQKNHYTWLCIAFSGIFIFLASFSKGITGIFPIVVIGLYWLLNRNTSPIRVICYSTLIILIPAMIYSLLIFLSDDASKSIGFYLNERFFYRIQHEPVVTNRFYIAGRLFTELLPTLFLVILLQSVFWLKSIRLSLSKGYRNHVILFMLIGMSGSLPLMLTNVQKAFYFIPALPFYAIGFAMIIAPGLKELITRIDPKKHTFKLFNAITVVLLIVIVTFSGLQMGKAGRDPDVLYDVYQIGKIVPKNSIVGIDKPVFNYWNFQFYLLRYFYISTDPSQDKKHQYYIGEKTANFDNKAGWEKVPLKTKKYDLYKTMKQ